MHFNKMEAQRADKYLKSLFPSLTSRHIEEALTNEMILLGKNPLKKKGAYITEAPDCSRLEAHLEKLRQGNPELDLKIIHDEPDFCVVDKLPGMPSQPIHLMEDKTVTHWALAKFPALREIYTEVQPTVTPHRLDVGTSGLQIVSKTKENFEEFRKRFENHEIQKEYFAWCYGSPFSEQFEIDKTLSASRNPAKMELWGFESEGKPFPAKSIVTVLKQLPEENIFLCRVQTDTGVRHQVRLHLQSEGFPLIGDSLYDPEYESRSLKPAYHLLRASKLLWENRVFAVPDSPLNYEI